MSTDTIPGRVARGAALLDDKLPDWWQRINLGQLDLSNSCRCILGQTWEGDGSGTEDAYWEHLDFLLPDEIFRESEYGFNAMTDDLELRPSEYAALTAEWRRVILARRGGEGR